MIEIFDHHNSVRAHNDSFADGTPDVEWISQIATWDERPVIVCGDSRILRNKVESQVLRDSRLTAVFLAKGWTKLAWDEFAWKIVRAWPSIVRAVTNTRHPAVFELKVGSLKVELNPTWKHN